MRNNLETLVTIIQTPSSISYTCPYCGERVIEDFEDFLCNQGLSWIDFPDWAYNPIKCSKCGEEIDASYLLD